MGLLSTNWHNLLKHISLPKTLFHTILKCCLTSPQLLREKLHHPSWSRQQKFPSRVHRYFHRMLKKPRRYMRPVRTTKQDNISLLYMQVTAQHRNHHGTQLLTDAIVTVKSAPFLCSYFQWQNCRKIIYSKYLFFTENFLLASMLPRHEASTGCSE